MPSRHAPALALALSAAVLAGCSGAPALERDRDRDRDGISMVPYRDRVADDGREAPEDDGDALEDCGDPDDAEELEMSAAGAELEVVVPADAGDDPVEELEDYREDSDAGPVCWVVVRVDNTGGDGVVDLPLVEVVAADGERVRLQRASEALAAWSDLRPDDEDATVRAVELVAAEDGVVGPGEEGEVVFVATTDLDAPRGVRVQPSEGAALVRAQS